MIVIYFSITAFILITLSKEEDASNRFVLCCSIVTNQYNVTLTVEFDGPCEPDESDVIRY